MTFMAGLEGCADDSAEDVEQLILSCLHSVFENGVEQQQIEAALHQLELNQREITGDTSPFGLQLILAGLSTALHRGDPIQLLDLEPVLELLRERVLDRGYIPGLIQRLLLDNAHRLTLTLKPSLTLAEENKKQKKKNLHTSKQISILPRKSKSSNRQTHWLGGSRRLMILSYCLKLVLKMFPLKLSSRRASTKHCRVRKPQWRFTDK